MITETALTKPLTPITDEDRIFAAGFFEGDGSAGIYSRPSRSKKHPERRQFDARGTISNSNYEVLRWFRDRWGGAITGAEIRPSPALITANGTNLFSATKWQWMASHRIMARFLRDIYPHLRFKRAVVENILAFVNSMGTQGGYYHGLPTDIYAVQLGCFERHRVLMAKAKADLGRYPKELRLKALAVAAGTATFTTAVNNDQSVNKE